MATVLVTTRPIARSKAGMRDILIELAAGMFGSFPDCGYNCRTTKFDNHDLRVCNIPDLVWIRIGEVAWILVQVTYDAHGLPLYGDSFECDKTKSEFLEPWFKKYSAQKIADNLQVRAYQQPLNIECLHKSQDIFPLAGTIQADEAGDAEAQLQQTIQQGQEIVPGNATNMISMINQTSSGL
ncbi:hypothetical protein CC80DRAFT_542599 [Byssothecium circinans]|uniref:Uncharacterized protein n=1 Tax=Byssothecium circinans TaxID=147558 RepID=A0A6A5UEW5_9PLEO|nr:hypothetical protein CC80DRAFT_542599 [Byssothecium circinans]